MVHSLADNPTLTCPECGQIFQAEIWIIVDSYERPDLLQRARDGMLHQVTCSNNHTIKVDAPLLLLRSLSDPPLFFSPAQATSTEQDREQAKDLVAALRNNLGNDWQDARLPGTIQTVPRELLPALLSDDSKVALAADGVTINSPEDLDQELAGYQNNLGNRLSDRYWQTGDLADLERSVAAFEEAVARTPPDSPDRAMYQNNLGNGLRDRFWRTGDIVDLEQAVAAFEEAVAHTPPDSPDQAGYQNNLGNGLNDRYGRTGDIVDLERAVAAYDEAVARTPPDSPDQAMYQNNLGNGLSDRYGQTGDLADLERAVAVFEEALARTPSDSPNQAICQNSLGIGLCDRYGRMGDLEDLERAVAAFEEAVVRTPPDSPDQALYQNSLGNGLRVRYGRSGDLVDLERAVAAFEEAVVRTPLDSPDRAIFLNSLGNGLRDRYTRTGDLTNLEQAVAVYEEAVARTPPDSPDRAIFLNSLGTGLSTRYRQMGDLADLERAVTAYEEAVAYTAPNSPNKAMYQNNLGTGLRDHYRRTGNFTDLERAVTVYEEAVACTPRNSPNRPIYQNSLGIGLSTRYGRTGDLADLERAVGAFEEAVARTPPDSPDRAMYLNSLGNGLRDRYRRTGDLADLERSVFVYENAVASTSPDSPDRAMYQNNLGAGRSARYRQTGDLTDLERSVAAFEQAVARTPPNSPHRVMYQNNLGTGLSDRYRRTGDLADQDRAFKTCRNACLLARKVNPAVGLSAARSWSGLALQMGNWIEVQLAARQVRRIFAGLVHINILQTEQESWRSDIQGLAAAEAYAEARLDNAEAAAIALETGQAQQLNAALGRVRDRVILDRLAAEFPEIFRCFKTASEQRSGLEQSPGDHEMPVAKSTEWRAQIIAAQAELDRVVAEIRSLAGFEKFFAKPVFADVAAAALLDHALAYLTVTMVGSVVVLLTKQDATAEAEGVTTEAILAELTSNSLDQLLLERQDDSVVGGLLPGQLTGRPLLSVALNKALPKVGNDLMQSLADRLFELGIDRVALIPSGQLNLLPLHAATIKGRDGKLCAFMDEFVVSFAPSAQALVESRDLATVIDLERPTAVVVGNPLPLPEGAKSLAYAHDEAQDVASLFVGRAELLTEKKATHETTLSLLPGKSFLHFATHGFFNPIVPPESGLVLSGEDMTVLSLREICRESLERTRLAVLSACQTGITDFNRLPDEVIGLPAGFLQAGVPGVVASLWPVDDRSTSLLMQRFYRHLLIDEMEPAAALREAQLWLRTITRHELGEYYMSYLRLNADAAYDAHEEIMSEGDLDKPMYAEPYHWAAFTFTGA